MRVYGLRYGLLERAAPRGRRSAFSFPPRRHLQTEPVAYLSLAGHALSQSLLFVLTYSLIVAVGVVGVIIHLVATHYPLASRRAQEKIVLLLLKLLATRFHRNIAGFIWEQVLVGLVLFLFACLLNVGTLRAWNRRADRLRLHPDVLAAQPSAPRDTWPPPPTGR